MPTFLRIAMAAALLSSSASIALAANHYGPVRDAYAMERGASPAGSEGREVRAPAWSFACMTDHGPSPCGEPMWVYGPLNR
jgi:hypothetical protein